MKNKKVKRRIPPYIIIEALLIAAVLCGLGYYYVHAHMSANNSAPVITVEGTDNAFSVNDGEEALLQGVSAEDKEDGNVTDSIIIESISPFFDGKTRTVTYVAFDSSNNVTKLERDITYKDYKPPVFTNENRIYVPTGDYSEILARLSAEDVIDGDISDQIKLEINNVVTGVPGDYAVQITVTNSCGDVAVKDIVVTVTGEEAE